MENLKVSSARLSSLFGFINSKISNDLNNFELLITADESSIQPIELKSKMKDLVRSINDDAVGVPLDYSKSTLDSLEKSSHIEHPLNLSLKIRGLPAKHVAQPNSRLSYSQQPRSSLPPKKRHFEYQDEERDSEVPRMDSPVDSNTTGADDVVLIPATSQVQIHQSIRNAAAGHSSLHPKSPGGVSNIPSKKEGVTPVPVPHNSSAIPVSQVLLSGWPRYTLPYSDPSKRVSSCAPISLTNAYVLGACMGTIFGTAAAATKQHAPSGSSTLHNLPFYPSATQPVVSRFSSGTSESQARRSFAALSPDLSYTCSDQSTDSNKSRLESTSTVSTSPFSLLVRSSGESAAIPDDDEVGNSQGLYEGSIKSGKDYKSSKAYRKLRRGSDEVIDDESKMRCLVEGCGSKRSGENETVYDVQRKHGMGKQSLAHQPNMNPTAINAATRQNLILVGSQPEIYRSRINPLPAYTAVSPPCSNLPESVERYNLLPSLSYQSTDSNESRSESPQSSTPATTQSRRNSEESAGYS